jgi:RNA processing factor Prp31
METPNRDYFKRKREEMTRLHYESSKRRLVEDYQKLEYEMNVMERDIERRMENLNEVKEQMKRVNIRIKQGDEVLAAQVGIIDDIEVRLNICLIFTPSAIDPWITFL